MLCGFCQTAADSMGGLRASGACGLHDLSMIPTPTPKPAAAEGEGMLDGLLRAAGLDQDEVIEGVVRVGRKVGERYLGARQVAMIERAAEVLAEQRSRAGR